VSGAGANRSVDDVAVGEAGDLVGAVVVGAAVAVTIPTFES